MKFGIGDKVKIINYGHQIWERIEGTDKVNIIDIHPDLVGQIGMISKAEITQGIPEYAIEGLAKHAWYDEGQLEMVSRNPNND